MSTLANAASATTKKKKVQPQVPKKRKRRKQQTKGFTGVTTNGKGFAAKIPIARKSKHLGTFQTKKEAALAYDRAALLTGDKTFQLNFPNVVHDLKTEPPKKKRKGSSKTGFTGVSKTKNGHRFASQIRVDKKLKYVGTFDSAKEAAVAYDTYARKTGHSGYNLNFPKKQDEKGRHTSKSVRMVNKSKKKPVEL